MKNKITITTKNIDKIFKAIERKFSTGKQQLKRPKITYCYENVRCIKVYDADTITVIIDFGMKLTQEIKVRFARINAKEVRGKEKKDGIKARDYLRERILDKNIKLESKKFEKYGRLLCEVYYKNKNLNDELVSKKLAKYVKY